jgi:hypothetical protein
MTENPESAKFWAKTLAPYRTPSDAIALRQLAETLIPLVALTGLMLHGYSVGWWWVFALMPLASIFLVRTFVLQHDCGHGSLFRTRWANDLVGSLLGVLTLTPYYYWKRTHAIHHATSGNLDRRDFGDIDTITVAEYRALSAAAPPRLPRLPPPARLPRPRRPLPVRAQAPPTARRPVELAARVGQRRLHQPRPRRPRLGDRRQLRLDGHPRGAAPLPGPRRRGRDLALLRPTPIRGAATGAAKTSGTSTPHR